MWLRRFVPRHDDELELEVDDPLLVEVQSEDYWYEGYNMRTGARGIFPAYYAIEVARDAESYKGEGAEKLKQLKVTNWQARLFYSMCSSPDLLKCYFFSGLWLLLTMQRRAASGWTDTD